MADGSKPMRSTKEIQRIAEAAYDVTDAIELMDYKDPDSHAVVEEEVERLRELLGDAIKEEPNERVVQIAAQGAGAGWHPGLYLLTSHGNVYFQPADGEAPWQRVPLPLEGGSE